MNSSILNGMWEFQNRLENSMDCRFWEDTCLNIFTSQASTFLAQKFSIASLKKIYLQSKTDCEIGPANVWST